MNFPTVIAPIVEADGEALHQAAFTEIFDLSAAMGASRSFRRLVSAVKSLSDASYN